MYWIDKIFSKKPNYNYVFPYSTDTDRRKSEMIQNLENGVMYEDLGVFVPWHVQYRNLQRFVRQKTNLKSFSDTGLHKILGGLDVYMDPHLRMVNSLPLTEINAFLGVEDAGHLKYMEAKRHLICLLGEPIEKGDVVRFSDYDDRDLLWVFARFQISLNVWERFAVHYRLSIQSV